MTEFIPKGFCGINWGLKTEIHLMLVIIYLQNDINHPENDFPDLFNLIKIKYFLQKNQKLV